MEDTTVKIGSLLNRSRVRKFILERWATVRVGHQITRVSAEALDELEARLKAFIQSKIESHPSVGKTFK